MKCLRLRVNLDFKRRISIMIGFAQYGESTHGAYYGIFGHVDVMPLKKDGFPALALTVRDGRLTDVAHWITKGPHSIETFMRYMCWRKGVTFDRPVRIVFFWNEMKRQIWMRETLNERNPSNIRVTPDCKWPVVYGERGRLRVSIIRTFEGARKTKLRLAVL